MKRILRTHHLDSLEGKCSCATEEKGTNVIVLWDEVPYTEAVSMQQDKNSSTTSEPVTFALLKDIIWGDVKSTGKLKSDSDRSA